MPALNFQARFSGPVLIGTKRSTIRLPRRDGRNPKPGQALYLFTGMRTRQCRRLCETVCKRVSLIRISHSGRIAVNAEGWLTDAQSRRLAIGDGFGGVGEMLNWFRQTHGLPFTGLLIEW